MIIQFCGLSGAGKSTLAARVKEQLVTNGYRVEIIDGDEYRKVICRDLGFSKADREENIRRLAFIAHKFSSQGIIVLISAINPYEHIRQEVAGKYDNVKTVFVDCDLDVLIARDTKGLYKKAMLPEGHPDKLDNLTGVGDTFERPQNPDLVINTGALTEQQATHNIVQLIKGSAKKENVINGINKKESWKRSIIKSISYRIFGTLATIAISYLFTGKVSISLSIGAFDLLSKILLYYLHERFWNSIKNIE